MRGLRTALAGLWQRSALAQTSIVLCASLLGAQMVAFVMFCGQREVTLLEAARTSFADTLRLSVTGLPALPPADGSRALWVADARADVGSLDIAPAELLARVRHERPAPWSPIGSARASVELKWSPAESRAGVELAEHPSGKGYVAALELGDGRWLNGLFATPAWTSPFVSQNWTLHIVSLGVMMLASVLLSRRLTEPMRRFAEAAGQVGHGRHAVLPASGPSEVRRTAAAFDAMQRRIHALVDDRTHLLSAIGHDLRTPLTSARLRAHLVDEENLRTRLLGDLDRLEAITESALDLVRGLAEEPAVRLDLHVLLNEVTHEFRDIGAEASVVGADVPVHATCRPVMLRRAVTNLVDNALKHGGGRAELSVHREQTGEVAIRVRDHGPGIDEAGLEEAFEPFRRLEGSRSRATGGAGLGLTLARSVAKRHGGDIGLARAKHGRGTVATLRLPGT